MTKRPLEIERWDRFSTEELRLIRGALELPPVREGISAARLVGQITAVLAWRGDE